MSCWMNLRLSLSHGCKHFMLLQIRFRTFSGCPCAAAIGDLQVRVQHLKLTPGMRKTKDSSTFFLAPAGSHVSQGPTKEDEEAVPFRDRKLSHSVRRCARAKFRSIPCS